ncbi:ADP-glyceromanno-heptose 6-epimerase [Candidatus Sumerlaeota bacterium]|nr:ADP-glyceromanno-heptose 6-epimerase [Candidatus Sumerlaeota bacterium]
MTQPIIVTGGAGFIGRNVVAALNAAGHDDIVIVDHLSTDEKWRNLVGLRFEDYLDRAAFIDLVRSGKAPRPDTVIHLGACSSTTETDAGYLMENNYRYTRELCEWCLSGGIRFVYASSAATYGAGEQGYSDADDVTPTLTPLNMYGYSKHLFDLWALRHGLFGRIAGIKYFNVFGPYEDHKGDMRSVVHKAYHQILETGELRLFKSHRPEYEDGKQLRDFIYVKDAVDVTLFLADHPQINGLFNCGTGQARTWLDLATAVFRAMDRELRIVFIDMPEHLREKYQYFTEAQMDKLRAAGYKEAYTPLEDGVRDYVQHYLMNRS